MTVGSDILVCPKYEFLRKSLKPKMLMQRKYIVLQRALSYETLSSSLTSFELNVSSAPAMGFHENSANGRQDSIHGKIPFQGKSPFSLTVFKVNSPVYIYRIRAEFQMRIISEIPLVRTEIHPKEYNTLYAKSH